MPFKIFVVVVPSPPLRRSLSSPRQLFIVGVRKHSLCELYQLPRSCAVSMATLVKGRGLICQANQRGRDFKIKARNVTGRCVYIYIQLRRTKELLKGRTHPNFEQLSSRCKRDCMCYDVWGHYVRILTDGWCQAVMEFLKICKWIQQLSTKQNQWQNILIWIIFYPIALCKMSGLLK